MTEERAAAFCALQDDIDLELLDIWAVAGAVGGTLEPLMIDEAMRDAMAHALRCAWASGYNAALAEGRAGMLGAFAAAHPIPPV